MLDSKLVSYDGNGAVSFLTISPGFIDLANDSGSDLSRIFCSSRPLGETGSSGDFVETTVVIDIQSGTETECYWFTFPEEPNDTFSTITVETYECGPAFPESTANSTVQDWRDACPDPLSGVIFAAERSGIVSDVGATEVDGKVLLHVLPGEIGVYERFPEGYDSGFVWCEIRDDASNPEYVNAGMIIPAGSRCAARAGTRSTCLSLPVL